ncbi:MAG: NAD(P)-dependent glycerol-1-phosphate dehydrogenase [Candidatus Thermoplasmatota archaeon]
MKRFTKSKRMVFPREIIVGHKTTPQIKDICDRISGEEKKALVVADKKTRKILGKKIEKILSKAGYGVKHKQISKATVKEVNKTIDYAYKNEIDILLGVGGGSVIDVTKLSAFDLRQPFISVPTSAAHDGIASPRASLKHQKGSVSKNAISPDAILADTEVILKAPYRMLAAGCTDVIANISAVKDWQLVKRLKNEEYSSHAAVLAETAAQMIINNADDIRPNSEEAAWLGVKSMIVSGVAMSVAGNTRPASGAEHMFSHMLDHLGRKIMLKSKRHKKPLHGEQCGLAAIMMIYLHGGDWKMIRDTLEKIGAPTTSEELGLSKRKIVEALVKAHDIRPERYTILGEKGLTKDAAKKLAKITGVI